MRLQMTTDEFAECEIVHGSRELVPGSTLQNAVGRGGSTQLRDDFQDVRNQTLASFECVRECIDAVAPAVHEPARGGEIAMEQRFFDSAFLALDETGQ